MHQKDNKWVQSSKLSGIHAREWIAPAVVNYIMHMLTEQESGIPYSSHLNIYIIPVVNVDGYDYTRSSVGNLSNNIIFRSNIEQFCIVSVGCTIVEEELKVFVRRTWKE